MSLNRIQKLLFSEYCDFEDMVLVESPFAQTTREGKGLRQVHLGLTPTKLILATDVLPTADDLSNVQLNGIDPDVETLELIAVYPLECVNLTIFHRKKRQSLKARFSNNKVLYFELGGFEKRNMFWTLWNERIKLLTPECPGSSHSETSVATSTTNSTLYLHSSRKVVDKEGNTQLWFEYGCKRTSSLWTDRNLFLEGSDGLVYVPKMPHPEMTGGDYVRPEIRTKHCTFELPQDSGGDVKTTRVNVFRAEVNENCQSSLFLPAENYLVQRRFSESTTQSADVFTLYSAMPMRNSVTAMMFPEIAENCVKLWEYYREATSSSMMKKKHKRRYGIAPKPHFLHGLGPWNVPPGERYSIQAKRALSLVNIRRQPLEPELRLPVSKRQLVASVSCEAINKEEKQYEAKSSKATPGRPVIFFWTPEYWYRPRSAKDAYIELQNHLQKIREYREERDEKKKTRTGLFRKRRVKKIVPLSDSDENSSDSRHGRGKQHARRFFNVFHKDESTKKTSKPKPASSIQYLKKILKMDIVLTAWDFDSTTLAYQLTMIDRDLFLKIPPVELGILIWQQTSKNAPNIGALIAFSHRISCLVVTEILRDDSEQMRARLVARFINTAEKCNRISNFQSCKSVLSGLQSPSIYRLQTTWSYLRKKHATKYLVFEQLCRQYRDPRLQIYQRAFHHASQAVPYLPFIGDLISRLLDRIPDYDDPGTVKSSRKSEDVTYENSEPINDPPKPQPGIFKAFLMKLGFFKSSEEELSSKVEDKKKGLRIKKNRSESSKMTTLSDYYKHKVEDNRVERLKQCVELLEKYQLAAAHYYINRNELAREYLLKARYREEKDNFYQSLQTEPYSYSNNYE